MTDKNEMPEEIFIVTGDKKSAGLWSLKQINLERQGMGDLCKYVRADLVSKPEAVEITIKGFQDMSDQEKTETLKRTKELFGEPKARDERMKTDIELINIWLSDSDAVNAQEALNRILSALAQAPPPELLDKVEETLSYYSKQDGGHEAFTTLQLLAEHRRK